MLKATLDGAFSTRPPRVVDLRSSLPDRLFWDNYHLTMEGRRELSRLLADIYQRSM